MRTGGAARVLRAASDLGGPTTERPPTPRVGALVNVDMDCGAVLASEVQRQLVARSEDRDAREHRLNEKERSLRASQRLLRAKTIPLDRAAHSKVGRDDSCPCGSGFKYKRCHGS